MVASDWVGISDPRKIPSRWRSVPVDRPYSFSGYGGAPAARPSSLSGYGGAPAVRPSSLSGYGGAPAVRPSSLSGYGGGPNRCLVKVPGSTPGKIPNPSSNLGKMTKWVVRYEEDASDPTAVWRIATAVNHKADMGQQQRGDFQKVMTGLKESMNRVENLLQRLANLQDRGAINLRPIEEPRNVSVLIQQREMARRVDDLRQINVRSTPEGNFNSSSTGFSVVATAWDLDPLQPEDPRKLPEMVHSGELGIPEVKDYLPRKVPRKGICEQEIYGIDPYTHNCPKEIMPADLEGSIDDKHAYIEVMIPEIPEQEKRELPPQSGLRRLSCLIFVAAHMRNKALLMALLKMVERDDRWLWSTGLLWKPPPWPDFCAMGCDSVAQHGGYEVLVNFPSVKRYHISLDKAFEFNDYCRSHQPPISLIKAEVGGLLGRVFCDFGPEFTVLDVEGEDPHTGIIASISNDNPALISCVDDERLEFQNGDLVVFSEVQGMTELHDSKEGPANVCVIELGGTIGDIEPMNFVDALGQFSYRVGAANFCLVHVSLVPVLNVVGEQKTKPTQRSVQGLRGLVLTPNILACCSIKELEENVKEKLSQFCHVRASNIFTLYDVSNIRRIPLLLWDQKAHVAIHEDLSLESIAWEPNLEEWVARATLYDTLQDTIRIAMVGKYTSLSDSYLSVLKALLHASVACHIKLVVDWVVRIWDPGTGSKNMKWQSSRLGVVGGITFGAVSAAGKAQPEDLALKVESALYSAGVAESFCTGQIGKRSFWSQGIFQDSPVGTDEFMSFKKPTRVVLRLRKPRAVVDITPAVSSALLMNELQWIGLSVKPIDYSLKDGILHIDADAGLKIEKSQMIEIENYRNEGEHSGPSDASITSSSVTNTGRFEMVPIDNGKIKLPDWASDVTTPVWFPVSAIDDTITRGASTAFPQKQSRVDRMRMIALKLEFGAFHNQVFERTIAVHSTNPFHISKNVVDKCNGWFAPVAMVGLGQFIKKNATLTYAKEVDACLIRAMKFFVFSYVCDAVQCKVISDIPPACRKFEALGKVDPMVLCTTEESGEHIITGARELYLEICLKDLLKMLHKYPFSVLQKIGNIAYQLQLPDGVGVHVSQLKKHCGPTAVPSPDLPLISKDGKIRTEPIAVLEPIALPRKYRLVTQWLVQWGICFQKRLHEKMLISSRLYSQILIHTQLNLGFQIIILEDKYALEGKEMSDTAMTEELAIEVKSQDTASLVSDQLRWTAEM